MASKKNKTDDTESKQPKEKKPMKKLWGLPIWAWVVIVILVLGGISSMTGSNSDSETDSSQTVQKEETTEETGSDKQNWSIPYGELLSVTENTDSHVDVIKARIKPSYNNKATIDQNYFNVADYIHNNDVSDLEEIQYWAVAEMTDGSEAKVISFTVPKTLIEAIKANKNYAANTLGDSVTDLYILPSLLEDD